MADLSLGARNAVVVCMGVTDKDKVVVVTDEATEEVGHALAAECEMVGAPAHLLLIEEFTTRPANGYPEQMRQRIDDIKPTVSFLAAQAVQGEPAFRRPVTGHL